MTIALQARQSVLRGWQHGFVAPRRARAVAPERH